VVLTGKMELFYQDRNSKQIASNCGLPLTSNCNQSREQPEELCSTYNLARQPAKSLRPDISCAALPAVPIAGFLFVCLVP